MVKKVFVSGCFDLLHAGHVAFLHEAATYGDELHVSVGSDCTVFDLKHVFPTFTEAERVYMLNALSCVTCAFVGSGSGKLDFLAEFASIKPDVFVVNTDGASEDKRALCLQNGVEYVVLERIPASGLPARCSSELRKLLQK